jgi:hypothetical protein
MADPRTIGKWVGRNPPSREKGKGVAKKRMILALGLTNLVMATRHGIGGGGLLHRLEVPEAPISS